MTSFEKKNCIEMYIKEMKLIRNWWRGFSQRWIGTVATAMTTMKDIVTNCGSGISTGTFEYLKNIPTKIEPQPRVERPIMP